MVSKDGIANSSASEPFKWSSTIMETQTFQLMNLRILEVYRVYWWNVIQFNPGSDHFPWRNLARSANEPWKWEVLVSNNGISNSTVNENLEKSFFTHELCKYVYYLECKDLNHLIIPAHWWLPNVNLRHVNKRSFLRFWAHLASFQKVITRPKTFSSGKI
jgi:hypothetical protein